jgi:choline dehydrogenase-like flavoprotein
VLDYMTDHSVDLYLTTEDLADPQNRVTLSPQGRITIRWRANNLAPHAELVRRTTAAMKKAGYPMVFTQRMAIETNSHQCGTLVLGEDPATSVVSPAGHTHDLPNLWPTDSSVFPSSAAVNPAMTIAANSLRVTKEGLIHAL